MSVERLAALETKVAQQSADIAELKDMHREMLLKMARYEGKWGGVVMVVAALWAFVKLTGLDLAKLLGVK